MNETQSSKRWTRPFRFVFGFQEPIRRMPYLLVGLVSSAVKFAGDLAILQALGFPAWTPLQFLTPVYTMRFDGVDGQGALLYLGVWTLPFVWIGASMSFRRAVDAGLPGPVALFFFLPAINYLLILVLCLAPTRAGDAPPEQLGVLRGVGSPPRFLLSVSFGALFGLLIFWIAVALNQSYSLALFVGSPFAMGFLAAKLYGPDREPQRVAASTIAGQVSVLLAGGALLLLGLEGILCLAMAYPLAALLAFLGGQLGAWRPLDSRWATANLFVLMTLLPFLAAMGSPEAPLREVVSRLDIDAPPEVVWRNVVSFSDLPEPTEWIFHTGIAYPMRARIEGRGVGAVRHCEFSTGAFVEPITIWDEPRRLSFDVSAQPPTMNEWSPYRHIQPPHLTESLHSERGEFRLVPLPGGVTRLEGSTWYRSELFPQFYWTVWSDALIHSIHERVLLHIRNLSEAPEETPHTGLIPSPL